MFEPNCPYCEKNAVLSGWAIEIARFPVSTLYLFREQSHPGRVTVAYKDHVSEIADLSEEQLNAYMADVVKAAKAVHKAYKPDKINYGAYGDTMRHLHIHLVPKYKDGFEWNGIFSMNPQKKLLTDAEAVEVVEKIRQAL